MLLSVFKTKFKVFLILSIALVLPLACYLKASPHPVSIMQGATSETATVLSLLLDTKHNYSWKVEPHGGGVPLPMSWQDFPLNEDWKQVHLKLQGLDKNTTYTLSLMKNKKVYDSRNFQTLDFQKDTFSAAVTSCMNDIFPYSLAMTKMHDSLYRQKPDVVFLIGDNTYADSSIKIFFVKLMKGSVGKALRPANPETLVKRHIQTRNRMSLYRRSQLIPILGSWDDHDYGVNNGGSDYPHKQVSKKVFRQFFPLSNILEQGPGTAFAFTGWENTFIFTDNRTFRKLKSPDNEQGHYGKLQEDWILKQVRKSPHPIWLISGGQFFGGYHRFESFEGHFPKNFKLFLKKLKANSSKQKAVTFFSGDRHLIEVMQIPASVLGYTAWEITSSPFHSNLRPKKVPDKNDKRVFLMNDKNGFVLLRKKGPENTFKVSVYSTEADAIWTQNITF